MKTPINSLVDRAQKAAGFLAQLTSEQKNRILQSIASTINQHRTHIKNENQKDIEEAKSKGLSNALIDRLTLTDARIDSIIQGYQTVIALPDPIGTMLKEIKKENCLVIKKVRVPIGVIAIIYESRPNVTADVAALTIKTGNAVILRGGSESLASNKALLEAIQEGGTKAGLPTDAVQLITDTNRELIKELVQLEGKIDLVIPRGGEGLIKMVMELARVPVIKHYKGICHLYVDESADLQKALNIAENAKCQRPGVCNAIETLLVHKNIASTFLPKLVEKLAPYHVVFKGDDASRAIIPSMQKATEADWETEYLDFILAVKIVEDIDEAIQHINYFGSHHSDAIVSENAKAQDQFTKEIDSAAVYVNASTRFTDGAEFGMGVEIGISTDKLHARGPMGLEELTTYKYIGIGSGQIR